MNILSVNISNNKKALLILFISLLTVVTVLTRTVNNEQNMQWFDDSARDITVAALIVENGKYTDIRPGTGFTLPLKNSSLYFNFLAGLYWLSGKNSSVFLDLYMKYEPNIIPKITTPDAVIPSIQPNISICNRHFRKF